MTDELLDEQREKILDKWDKKDDIDEDPQCCIFFKDGRKSILGIFLVLLFTMI